MNKNVGPFLAFNDSWFKKHQGRLLRLLNHPIIGKFVRTRLKIQFRATTIEEIAPSFVIWVEGGKKVLQTHTHPKFSKRVYHSLKPLWWMLHAWDWAVADWAAPEWSFGFSTLTARPAAGSSSPVDGVVSRVTTSETFSDIRTGAGTDASDNGTSDGPILFASSTLNQYALLGRAIFCFTTSSITSAGVISSAVLSLRGDSKSNGLGSPAYHIAAATPAATNTLATSDYGQCQTTSFANIAYASFTLVDFNNFTLDSNGIANINKTGISKFSGQLSWDINNSFTGSWSSGAQSFFQHLMADTAGTASDPVLVVEYVIASVSPSASPSVSPSASPSKSPSASPSASPSISPSKSPSQSPSASVSPSASPSISPSNSPSQSPSTSISPSNSPSASPSNSPSQSPSASVSPSNSPSVSPSVSPSNSPSQSPSASPSQSPSASPSQSPSISPSASPSVSPSVSPSAPPPTNIDSFFLVF